MTRLARRNRTEQTGPRGCSTLLHVCLLLACAFGLSVPASAQTFPAGAAIAGDEPLFSLDTEIGSIDYLAGRGLRLGDTKLTIGGFLTVEADIEEGEAGTIELDGPNFLLLWEPFDSFRFFTELEIGDLLSYDTGTGIVDSNPMVVVERLYGEWSQSDALNVRGGKFQTPVGIWNLVPAEPFTWTATEPLLVETAFDEFQTGAALRGSFYPGDNILEYWLYGQFLDPISPPKGDDLINSSVGSRLRYGGPLGEWAVGASFLASERDRNWNFLGGLDAFWRLGPLEFQSEFAIVRGDIPDRNLWDVYVQGVYDLGHATDLLRGFYVVGRYEHSNPSGWGPKANLGDVGLTWIPTHFLILKAGYRFGDQTEDARRGFFSSISVLF